MSNAITRRQIIEDDAINWGQDYVKNLEGAVVKNKEFVASILALNEANNTIKSATNQKQLQEATKLANAESQKALNIIKEQTALETSLEKIRREKLQTNKVEIDLDIKKARATSELNKLIAEEEVLNQKKIKTEKEKIQLEKEANDLYIKKEQLKKAGLVNSKLEIDVLEKEERLKRQKISTLNEEEKSLAKQQAIAKNNTSTWKEQNQLELALISTKRKNQLATESTNQALIKERVELQATNKVMKQAALEKLGMVSAYTKLNNSRTEAKNKLRDLLVAEEKNVKAIKAAQKEYDILDGKIRKADAAVGDFSKNVGNYPFKNAATGLKNLIGAFGITTGIALFAGIMKGAYETIKKFDQGIADLSAITGATGKDLEYLRNKAIELGKGVEGGAIAVVEAYKLIASAKPELLDNVQALNQVTEAAITLSQAAGMQLPEAATALTDALNQFNLPAEKAGEFIDALANGAKFGSAEIPQITEALLKFGAVARSSNINIKESTALIELLAENGLKGADAGTALRNVLLKISAPDALPLKAKQAIESLGISLETLKDRTIPIQQKLELLKPILNDNSKLVKVFGLENVVAAQNIIGHTDRLKELTSKMGEFGTAEEQANIRMNTLQGDTIKLSATYDSFILSLTKGKGALTEFFRGAIQLLTQTITDWERLNKTVGELNVEAVNKQVKTDIAEISSGEKKYIAIIKTKNDELTKLQNLQKLDPKYEGIDKKIEDAKKEIELAEQKLDVEKRLTEMKKQGKLNDAIDSNVSVTKSSNELILKNIELRDRLAQLEKERADSKNLTPKRLKEISDAMVIDNKLIEDNNKLIGENNLKIRYNNSIINSFKKSPSIQTANPISNADTTASEVEDDKAKAARLAKEKKFADDYLKLLKDRINSENKLNQFRYEREIYYNELILNDDKQNSDERVDAYLQIQQVREASVKDAFENELQTNALARIEEKKRELETLGGEERITKAKIQELFKRSQQEIENTLKTGALRKGATDEEILAYEKYLLELKKLDDKALKEKQALVDSQAGQIQKAIDAKNQGIDTELNNRITKENELYKNSLEVAKGNFELIEQATIAHEQKLLKIAQDSNKEKLQNQIDMMQVLLDNNGKEVKEKQISAEKRAEIEKNLSEFRKQLSQIDVDVVKQSNEEINQTNKERAERAIQLQQEQSDRTKELAENLASSLIDLTNAIFDAKIASIDSEIQAVNDSYDEQIAAAGNNAAQKDLLEKEKEKKTKALEKERKKELVKAAIFNKIISLAQIGLDLAKTLTAINLAATEMDALAAFGFGAFGAGYRGIQIPLAIGTAAAQAAVVLATPLPKYKTGRKGGPAELAYTGDGYRHEVLSNPDGSNPVLTPNKPTLTFLNKDQMVHKSVDAYEDYVKASILSGITIDNRKSREFIDSGKGDYSRELLDELKRNTKAVEKQKLQLNLTNSGGDLNHQLWKMSNVNWNRR